MTCKDRGDVDKDGDSARVRILWSSSFSTALQKLIYLLRIFLRVFHCALLFMFLLSQLLQLYHQRISTSILLGVFVIVCYFFSTNICVDFQGSDWLILRRDSATAWQYTRDTTLYKMFKASNHNKTEKKKTIYLRERREASRSSLIRPATLQWGRGTRNEKSGDDERAARIGYKSTTVRYLRSCELSPVSCKYLQLSS